MAYGLPGANDVTLSDLRELARAVNKAKSYTGRQGLHVNPTPAVRRTAKSRVDIEFYCHPSGPSPDGNLVLANASRREAHSWLLGARYIAQEVN
jgi:hypothetical protein|tara:strand:- start:1350 stop:1631 length:282 start_codon:yes stop_codon:yes gene_type:complete